MVFGVEVFWYEGVVLSDECFGLFFECCMVGVGLLVFELIVVVVLVVLVVEVVFDFVVDYCVDFVVVCGGVVFGVEEWIL